MKITTKTGIGYPGWYLRCCAAPRAFHFVTVELEPDEAPAFDCFRFRPRLICLNWGRANRYWTLLKVSLVGDSVLKNGNPGKRRNIHATVMESHWHQPSDRVKFSESWRQLIKEHAPRVGFLQELGRKTPRTEPPAKGALPMARRSVTDLELFGMRKTIIAIIEKRAWDPNYESFAKAWADKMFDTTVPVELQPFVVYQMLDEGLTPDEIAKAAKGVGSVVAENLKRQKANGVPPRLASSTRRPKQKPKVSAAPQRGGN
jgi:hypothetical protein